MNQLPQAQDHEKPPHPNHDVQITVNGTTTTIPKGKYIVRDLKALIGVPADYELDQVLDGTLHPLDDAAEIHIKGKEVFVSHVRQGGSS